MPFNCIPIATQLRPVPPDSLLTYNALITYAYFRALNGVDIAMSLA
jgi:hypothetical protein